VTTSTARLPLRRFGVVAGRVAVSLAMACAVTACVVAPPRELDGAANDSRVLLEPHQQLVIRLDANPTTGYTWVAVRGATAVLVEDDAPFWRPVSEGAPLVGQGGWTTFRYSAVAEGSDTLELAYRRSWEKEAPPVSTFRLDVTVKKP
jgi:inhibitor of cysteine peptidase